MEALRLWSLTTSQPLRQLFHLATSTTTTNFSTRLVLRCSSATTSTTEGHNDQSSSSSCSLSSSSSTSDRDVIHTIHLKKVIKSNSLPLCFTKSFSSSSSYPSSSSSIDWFWFQVTWLSIQWHTHSLTNCNLFCNLRFQIINSLIDLGFIRLVDC